MNALNWLRDQVAELFEKDVLKALDGSFIHGVNDKWILALEIPLQAAFDLATDSTTRRTFVRHLSMLNKLYDLGEMQIEVMPVPIDAGQQIKRIRDGEQPTLEQQEDETWQAAAEERAAVLAKKRSSSAKGNFVNVGMLFVELKAPHPAAELTEKQFSLVLGTEEGFYLEDFEHVKLIRPAQDILAKVKSVWPRAKPASREVLDSVLSQMVWPGQFKLQRPRRHDWVRHNEDFMVEFFGQSRYDDTSGYHVEVDCYGRKTYVTCLVLRPPLGLEMVNDEKYPVRPNRAWGWHAWEGRRVRLSYKFEITGGRKLRRKVSNKRQDVISHAKSAIVADQNAEDYLDPVQASKDFYQHLARNGKVVHGRPMLIVSEYSPAKLRDAVEKLKDSVEAADGTVIHDQRLQSKLLRASFPGAKPLNRYERPIGLKLAALAMPYVTSAAPFKGPDYLGTTMGKEHCPVFGAVDHQLRRGFEVATVTAIIGPPGSGKTSAGLNMLAGLIERSDYVGHAYALAKDEIKLLDLSAIPAKVKVYLYNLLDHPGCLNPVRLLPESVGDPRKLQDEARVAEMKKFLKAAIGIRRWKDNWEVPLEDACIEVLRQAYLAAETHNPSYDWRKVIPSLYPVRDVLLGRVPDDVPWVEDKDAKTASRSQHQRELATALSTVFKNRRIADVACSNASSDDFHANLSQPGMHIIQQSGMNVPEPERDQKDFEDEHWVTLAIFDKIDVLSLNIAYEADIKAAMLYIEFHVTSRLSKGANRAEFMGRIGRAVRTLTFYDTHFPTDLSNDLREIINMWYAFSPVSPDLCRKWLASIGIEPTPARVRFYSELTSAEWNPDPNAEGGLKGAVMMRWPGAGDDTVAVLLDRYFIGEAFDTSSEGQDAKAFKRKQAEKEAAAKAQARAAAAEAASEHPVPTDEAAHNGVNHDGHPVIMTKELTSSTREG